MQARFKMPYVKYSDLEMAMDFVTSGNIVNASAYISRETGQIYWHSDDSDPEEEELPEDIDDSSVYAEIPSQRDLGLGKRLVMTFTQRFLPDAYEEIDDMFRRKGAYSRYKGFLHEHGKLEQWYEYEQSALKKALIEWAEDEGFDVEEGGIETAT